MVGPPADVTDLPAVGTPPPSTRHTHTSGDQKHERCSMWKWRRKMQEEEGPRFLLNRERLLRQWQWRFISLLGYCHKKPVVSGLREAPLGSNVYQGWSHGESMPSLFPILSWRIPGGWTPTKSQRQRNPLMRTTWASPEGGELGKEDVEGQKEQVWLSGEGEMGNGSHFSAVFSDGYKKGPSSALPILLLGQTDSVALYIPHRRQRLR